MERSPKNNDGSDDIFTQRFNEISAAYERPDSPPFLEQATLFANIQARHYSQWLEVGILDKLIIATPGASFDDLPDVYLQAAYFPNGPHISASVDFIVTLPYDDPAYAQHYQHIVPAYLRMPENLAPTSQFLHEDDIALIDQHVNELETLKAYGHLSLLSADLSHITDPDTPPAT